MTKPTGTRVLGEPPAARASDVRGRLAPSPTGDLHLGHARTFILAWAWARQMGGSVVVRLEDLDAGRCRAEFKARNLDDLAWLGLDWDGPVLHQSTRLPELRAACDSLIKQGLAYPCTCTRAELKHLLGAPHPGEAEPRYPGNCRGRYASVAEARSLTGREPVVRFVASADPISFRDGVHGARTASVADTVGDFVIGTRDGLVSYQLAVVVDDAFQGVTQVMRGADLLASTPRQLALQRALNLPPVEYAHVPLVLDPAGQRLAKRADPVSLQALRAAGVDARAIIAWAGISAGLELPTRVQSHELVRAFDVPRLLERPAAVPENFAAWLL